MNFTITEIIVLIRGLLAYREELDLIKPTDSDTNYLYAREQIGAINALIDRLQNEVKE